MDPKISVIIPTFNAEDYLHNAIESVMKQTIGFENIELILIDDNSTDDTKNILKIFSEKYYNVKAIYLEENSGSPSKPRNVGIKNSNADYIMFLDNDDTYCLDFCEKMYSAILEYDADIVSCRNYDNLNGKINKYHSILDKKDPIIKLNNIEEDVNLLSTTSMLIWNKIYKKELFDENNIKFSSHTLYEDVLFNLKAYINAQNIVFLTEYYGYNYNIRTNGKNKSTSQDFKKENLTKFFYGLKNIFNYLNEENKNFKNFECEMLIGFTKWLLLTNCEEEYKLKLLNEFKEKYKKYILFLRLEHIPLYQNIMINIGMKLISTNDFFFRIINEIFSLKSKM